MYCPTCGSEERQLSQYCRSCGTDLRSVRITLERPDAVTASAVSARENISRAIADRIRNTQAASELQKVAEDVLPEIEKFLESPEEKRMRRVRTGVILTAVGIGATVGALIASTFDEGLFVLLMPTLVLFCIGLAVTLNGLWFTLPRKTLPPASIPPYDPALSDNQVRAALPLDTAGFASSPNLRSQPEEIPKATSVTEHTTKHLAEKL